MRSSASQRAPHVCPYCQRCFRKKEHALRHVRSHTKERPFKCGVCNKTYPRSDTLKRHERSHEQDSLNVDTEDHRAAAGTSQQHQAVSSPAGRLAASSVTNLTEGYIEHDDSRPHFQSVQAIEANPKALAYQQSAGHIYPLAQTYAPLDIHSESLSIEPSRAPGDNGSVLDNSLGGLATSALYDDSWLLSNDFDIRAMNSALDDTIFEWVQAPLTDNGLLSATHHTARLPETQMVARRESVPEPAAPQLDGASRVSGTPFVDKWYTQSQVEDSWNVAANADSGRSSAEPLSQFNVDERYTANLSQQLRPRYLEETHLSVTFLNECLRLYFARFHPVFPVIHLPSFRPDSKNALLVLSMCSIGSLFIGSPKSNALGYSIYARLNKAILAGWETHLSKSAQSTFYMLQAALLGQTFGLLSEKPNNLIMTDMFHGTMLSWSRRLGKFGKALPELSLTASTTVDKTRAWRNWIQAEQLQRFTLAIHIHDAELASILHHEPLLRHTKLQHDTISSDALFEARTAQEWYSLLNHLRPQLAQRSSTTLEPCFEPTFNAWNDAYGLVMSNSQFASYAILENINAGISECRRLGSLDERQKQRFTQGLLNWLKCYDNTASKEKEDAFALRALWHSCFLNMTTDFNLLECALGREGRPKATDSDQNVQDWAKSDDAVRCLLHTVALQDHLESMRFNWTPSIHAPRILFNCGTAWICHRHWYTSSGAPIETLKGQCRATIDELREVQAQSWVCEQHIDYVTNMLSSKTAAPCRSIVYGVIELLQRLNRWSIANTFAGILRDAAAALFVD